MLLDDLRLALAFSTRLPLHNGPKDPEDLSRALFFTPLAGVLVASVTGGLYLLAGALGLPALVSALLAFFAAFWFTGGLHEDGLADFADAMGVTGDREKRIAVMGDSRIGTFGAAALVMTFLLRAGALATLGAPSAVLGILIASAALSRAYFSLATALLHPARKEGLAQRLSRPTLGQALIPLALGLAIAFFCLGASRTVIGFGVATLVAIGLLLLARARVGGYSGDVLGALQQSLEVATLLTFLSASSS